MVLHGDDVLHVAESTPVRGFTLTDTSAAAAHEKYDKHNSNVHATAGVKRRQDALCRDLGTTASKEWVACGSVGTIAAFLAFESE